MTSDLMEVKAQLESSGYYSKYSGKRTVELFVDNLIYGNISINDFSFKLPGREKFIDTLRNNVIEFKKNPTEEIVNSIYEAIITLRVNGALSFVIRDLSAEDLIRRLNEEFKKKDSAIQLMQAEIVRLTADMQKYMTVEQPAKVDLSAVK